jgi:putative sterol carrier protein
MENQGGGVGSQPWSGKTAPGLAGVHGRLRIMIGDKPFATLVVEGTYVALFPDTSGSADATAICADEDAMRKLLRGELNPLIASMRKQVRLAGDRGFGMRVVMGLQVGSPFATDADAGINMGV